MLFVDSFAVCTFHTANLLDSFLTNNQRHLHSPPTASARAAATTRIEIQIETDSKYGRPNNAEHAEEASWKKLEKRLRAWKFGQRSKGI